MWRGRKWKLNTLHQIKETIDVEEISEDRRQSQVSIDSVSKKSSNESMDEDIYDPVNENKLFFIGKGHDKRIKCRNCGEGGHYKE